MKWLFILAYGVVLFIILLIPILLNKRNTNLNAMLLEDEDYIKHIQRRGASDEIIADIRRLQQISRDHILSKE